MAGTERDGGTSNDNCGEERVNMAGKDQGRTTKRYGVSKVAAALVALLLLGVMASSALADGDPFSAVEALISSRIGIADLNDAVAALRAGSALRQIVVMD